MAILICLVLFLAMTGHSGANYCLCKDGVGDQALQKAIDYACGAGADCTPITQNGPCYNPNTVKDHCNYAVNSYFQKKGQVQGSCDFSGSATVSPNPPSNVPSTCSFPSSSTGTPSTTPPTTGTPSTAPPTTGTPSTTPPTTGTTPPTTGTPSTAPPTTGTPSTAPPTTGTTTGTPSTSPTTGTTPGTGTGTTAGSPNVFGGTTLGPSGTTTGITDPNDAVALFRTTGNALFTFLITLLIVGLNWI